MFNVRLNMKEGVYNAVPLSSSMKVLLWKELGNYYLKHHFPVLVFNYDMYSKGVDLVEVYNRIKPKIMYLLGYEGYHVYDDNLREWADETVILVDGNVPNSPYFVAYQYSDEIVINKCRKVSDGIS